MFVSSYLYSDYSYSGADLFRKLKKVKNNLHSSMSQEKLSGVSVLGLECDIIKAIVLNETIQTFASQIVTRISLI